MEKLQTKKFKIKVDFLGYKKKFYSIQTIIVKSSIEFIQVNRTIQLSVT